MKGIDNLLNPAQLAEEELEVEVKQLFEQGCLQKEWNGSGGNVEP